MESICDSKLVDEGLTKEQTFSKHMFARAGMLVYRSKDASLVRHQSVRNPWKLPVGGDAGEAPPLVFPGMEETDDKHLGYVVSHVDEMETVPPGPRGDCKGMDYRGAVLGKGQSAPPPPPRGTKKGGGGGGR